MKTLLDHKSNQVISQIEAMDFKWVLMGAFVLSFLGGNINVMMLSFFHVPVSHMTGAFSHLSMIYGAGIDVSSSVLTLWIVAAFFAGTVISGLLIGKESIFPGNHYSNALWLEGLILLLADAMIQSENKNGVALAALACGIQNAMATTYLGLNIRTTHVSGIVTDLGLALGHFLRGHPLHTRKTILLISLLLGFFGGGVIAAWIYLRWGKQTMIVPALLALSIASGYRILKRLKWI
ncbi:MAG: YoaK family protein [Verrucomicrobiota bacterium]